MDAEPLIASSPVDVTILRSGSPPSEKTPLLDAEDVSCGLKRAKTFEEALDKVGVGFFHIILIIVAGCALASDSVEVQCISFVTPQLDNPGSDLHPTKVGASLYTLLSPPPPPPQTSVPSQQLRLRAQNYYHLCNLLQ